MIVQRDAAEGEQELHLRYNLSKRAVGESVGAKPRRNDGGSSFKWANIPVAPMMKMGVFAGDEDILDPPNLSVEQFQT